MHRCRRMNKDCQPSPPVRKRRTITRHPINKTSKLEEKVDGLVTLLKSATQGTPGTVSAGYVDSLSASSTASNIVSSMDTIRGDYQNGSNSTHSPQERNPSEPESTSPASSLASPPRSLKPTIQSSLEPNLEDAESYLNRFQTKFIQHLPFFSLSSSVTAYQLRLERPMLWLCIMTAASNKSTQQVGLSREVRCLLGREVYVEGNRSMDVLLAVLTYAAW